MRVKLTREEVVSRLRACAEDPMWPDHAEVNKATLRAALAILVADLPNHEEVVAYEFRHQNGHAIVDYSEHTYVGHLTAEKGYTKHPLVYQAAAATPVGAPLPTGEAVLPSGYVLVPVEPTPEMIDAGCDIDARAMAVKEHLRMYPMLRPMASAGQELAIRYRAMLEAAPTAPATGIPDRSASMYVPFNAAERCQPTLTQCPRCNNPSNACDRGAGKAVVESLTSEDPKLTEPAGECYRNDLGALSHLCLRYSVEFDGFTGTVIGHYTRLDGEEGVVMQQDGTKVVHVYRRKWLKPVRGTQ